MNSLNIHNVNAWGFESHTLTPGRGSYVVNVFIRNEDGVVFELSLFSEKPLKARKLDAKKSYGELEGD